MPIFIAMNESGFDNFLKNSFKKLEESNVLPYIFLFASIFFSLSLLSFSESSGEAGNIFGRFGHFFSYGMCYLFGRASYIPGLVFLVSAVLLFRGKAINFTQGLISLPLLVLAFAIALNMAETPTGSILDSGGVLGSAMSTGLEFVFGYAGKMIITYFLIVYAVLSLATPSEIRHFFKIITEKLEFSGLGSDSFQSIKTTNPPWFELKSNSSEDTEPKKNIPDKIQKNKFPELGSILPKKQPVAKNSIYEGFFEEENRVYRFKKTPENIRMKLENTEPLYWKLKLTDRMSETSQTTTLEKPPVREENPGYKDFADTPEEEFAEMEEIDETFEEEEAESEISSEAEAEIEDVVENTFVPLPRQTEQLLFTPSSSVPSVKLKYKNYQMTYGKIFQPVQHTNDPASRAESERVARKIEDVILQYGYESKVVSIEKGPIITRYELTPPPGIKLGRITSLSDELRLYLAVKSIRIVAPIPGRSTIGIEVPNKLRDDVYLSDLLKGRENNKSKELDIPLGKDISGKNIFISLNKLPHLLIAGTTGSGKSCLVVGLE